MNGIFAHSEGTICKYYLTLGLTAVSLTVILGSLII